MPDGGRKHIGRRNAKKLKAERAEEVRTEAKAEGNRKCEPGKPGKTKSKSEREKAQGRAKAKPRSWGGAKARKQGGHMRNQVLSEWAR